MRIGYVIPYLERPSGWRTLSCGIIGALGRHVEPVLFAARGDVEVARALFPEQERIIGLPVTQQAALGSPGTLPKLLGSLWSIRRGAFPAVELVHSLEAYPTGLIGSWLARRLGAGHVITPCGTYGVIWKRSILDRPVYSGVLRRAAAVFPISDGTARLLEEHFGKALRNVRVQKVLPGNHYHESVPRSRANRRRIPATPTIISVGQVKPRKGYHVSLAAFARVRERIPGARYRIVGSYTEGSYFRRLQRILREERIEGVEFLGAVSQDELERQYEEASVFLLASQLEGLHFEGFGLVFLEAGAYGLPVVGTRTGGLSDAVKDGVTGFLVGPEDIEGMAGALVTLLEDPARARRMGLASRDHAEALTWERYAREQAGLYEEILGARS